MHNEDSGMNSDLVGDIGTVARRYDMITKRMTILNSLAAISSVLVSWPALAAPSRAMRLLDTDKDGTVDLDEAKKAASTLFDKLDRDHDGTLDRRELGGRLSTTEFALADPDKDGTLSKDEYLKVVESRFKAADSDNDGTLDEKELRSRAGQALLRLLQ
jgi:Ca2+-binding EF-hand superfamily protein